MTPRLLLLLAVALAAAPAVAAADPTSVRAAHEATAQARSYLIALKTRGGVSAGDVTLRPIGRTTAVRVRLQGRAAQTAQIYLYRGSDCMTGRLRAAADAIPLNQANSSSQTSETIVQLPIERLSGNYVVDVRNATAQGQASTACARILRGR